jgi:hypothetical protein
MSIVPHGPIHEPLSSIAESISSDGDPKQTSIVSCLVPNSIAIAAR